MFRLPSHEDRDRVRSHKDAVPLTQACEFIVSHIEKNQEPFGVKRLLWSQMRIILCVWGGGGL